MNVIVTPDDLDDVFFDGSVVIVTGTSEDGRSRITFVGDARPTRELLEAVSISGEPKTAYTEDFAVTRIRPIAGAKRS
jgi:hypothetical protein